MIFRGGDGGSGAAGHVQGSVQGVPGAQAAVQGAVRARTPALTWKRRWRPRCRRPQRPGAVQLLWESGSARGRQSAVYPSEQIGEILLINPGRPAAISLSLI